MRKMHIMENFMKKLQLRDPSVILFSMGTIDLWKEMIGT